MFPTYVSSSINPSTHPTTMHISSLNSMLSTNPRTHHLYIHSPNSLKPPVLSLKSPPNLSHFATLGHTHSLNCRTQTPQWRLRVYESNTTVQREALDTNNLNFDLLLSIAELVCLVPCAIVSIGCVLNFSFLSSQKAILLNRVLVWQIGLLGCAVGIGGLIRRRQWGRVYGVKVKTGGSKLDLVGRIEKLEEDLRCSTTVTRMLSRQLEKLGIRFRVTRKSLKEPISETAALALKNSEVTQALEMQKGILEKELGEMQKVLLAMQEQQQKQLELILAVVKAGKFRESKRQSVVESTKKQLNPVPVKMEEKQRENQIESGVRRKIPNNDGA